MLLAILDLIVGLAFLLYYLYIALILARRKLVHLREKIWKLLGEHNPQPTLLQRILQRVVKLFVRNGSHIHAQTIQTEANLISSEPTNLKSNTVSHNDRQINDEDHPHTLQYIDAELKGNRNNLDRLNSLHRLNCSSDDMLQIETRPGSQIELLRSQNNPFIRNTPKNRLMTAVVLSSQAQDTRSQRFFRLNSDLDKDSASVLIDDPHNAPFKKATLEDRRFGDIDKVQIKEGADNSHKEQDTEDNESKSYEKALSLYGVLQENGIESLSGRSTLRAKEDSIDNTYKEKNEQYNEGESYGDDNPDQRKL